MLVAEATSWVDECGVRAACTLQPASSAVCREFMLMVSRVVCYTPSLVGSPVFFVRVSGACTVYSCEMYDDVDDGPDSTFTRTPNPRQAEHQTAPLQPNGGSGNSQNVSYTDTLSHRCSFALVLPVNSLAVVLLCWTRRSVAILHAGRCRWSSHPDHWRQPRLAQRLCERRSARPPIGGAASLPRALVRRRPERAGRNGAGVPTLQHRRAERADAAAAAH